LGGSFPVVAGTVTAGPYTNGDTVTLTVEHSDPACNFSLGDFETGCTLPGTVCENSMVLTPGTPQPGATTTGEGSFSDSNTAPNVNPCSTSYNDLEYWFEYTAVETGETLDLTVTDFTNSYYGVFVLDNCPDSAPNCIASYTNGSSSADIMLSTPALTAGTTYYIVITDWIQGTTSFIMNSVVNAAPTCLEATNLSVTILSGDVSATVSWNAEATATSGYNWAVMNIGEDPDVDTPVSMGTTAAGVTTDTAIGLTAGNSYDFYVQSNCDTDGLSTWAGPVNFTAIAPPANDECSGAEALTVNADYSCAVVTSGTVAGATDSGQDDGTCYGNPNNDVWYSFTAAATAHRVSLTNKAGSPTDMYMVFYDATPGCGSLGTPILCSDPDTANLTGLTIGTTYLVQVYTYSASSGATTTFDICVGTPPPPPANETCATATSIACGDSISGSSEGSNGTKEGAFACSIGNKGVWYSFIGDGGDMTISVSGSFDIKMGIASGSCGALVDMGCEDTYGSAGTEVFEITGTTLGETYYVYLAGWSSTGNTTGQHTIELTCSTVSVSDFASPDAFTFYPNPVSNMLNIKAQNNINNVAVYNMLGQEVLRTAPNAVVSEVDMSSLQTGAYFVKVTIENATKTIKVIKK